ncbi:dTMP kinase [Buchnera aphidicola (Muscaphis stroyani)]|uniref:Thymidylate kinase n=1 Tax=Buchnera aphidicola (Muscaphis stroyani) TaxID=1241869 RepID=A0A4D6Y5K0_9GAMM|nr:dTMP kinase [Buchnera aphidicola]QCI24419.1 dTMP kinase [Buchnera aphidicola (Muscaphis stroyani)]
MIKNKFIVIEGLEGAGKSNACICVKNSLKKYNIKNIILVRQPGGTPISEKIRKLVKNKFCNENLIKETELLLMYAARMQLVKKIIQPALKNGIWVISDRHDLSSLAYQGGGLGINEKLIKKLKHLLFGKFVPDLTIYLDVYPKIGLRRALNRKKLDQIEKRSFNFFEKTRKSYLKNLKLDKNSIKINANLKMSEVTQKIEEKISNWLKKQFL